MTAANAATAARCVCAPNLRIRSGRYTDLADDTAAEARLAPALCTDIRDLDTNLASLPTQLDPAGVMTSTASVGIINGAQVLGRLGDPARFQRVIPRARGAYDRCVDAGGQGAV
jgi:hypothetical protein